MTDLVQYRDGFAAASKEDVVTAVIETVRLGIEDGYIDPVKEFAKARKAKFFFETMEKELIPYALDELDKEPQKKFSTCQVEMIVKNGAARIQYDEDPEIARLKAMIAARQQLLKTAQNQTVYDADGAEVPRVSVSHDSRTISATIK